MYSFFIKFSNAFLKHLHLTTLKLTISLILMAEKVASELNLERDELDEELEFGKLFLQVLCNKVGQLEQVLIVSSEGSRKLLFFSIEIPKIYSDNLEFPNKVIKLIDDITATYFFKEKPKNLSLLNWCAKYMLFSFFVNQKQVNTLQFYWFKNKNRGEICPCFVCQTYCEENNSELEK